jgi:signal transduction histidine kinase
MNIQDINREVLNQSAFLSSLSDTQLDWLLQKGECIYLETGETLIRENVPQNSFYIVLDGDFEVSKQSDQDEVVIAVQGDGAILGEMSVIAEILPTATVRAMRRSRLLQISRDLFRQFILENPASAIDLLQTIMTRLQNTEKMLGQREKLASLGTLAAGLAHELNNPAAAARRSASQLRKTINDWLNSRSGINALNLDQTLNEIVMLRLRADIEKHDHNRTEIPEDPIQRSDRESELESRLEEYGMEDAWEFAPIMVDFGWNPSNLEGWIDDFDDRQVPVILRWLATGYIVHSLLDEICNSTERISEIVTAVKSYTYLDEAPRKEIDIHEGLENTLIILKHKLKQGVTVLRNYGRDLPRLEANGGELNQVWTNLIDNAIDAMGGKGTLQLTTRQENDHIVVEVWDDGPGIKPEVQAHIFEPFFTTKEPGKGTGLGLHVSYSIIKKHRGKIQVESQPGNTRFIVSLPLKQL